MNHQANISEISYAAPERVSTAPRVDAVSDSVQASHLLIAGTGRAGTSFLVRFMTELGLETHLSRRGKAKDWDDRANAGLEDDLLTAPPGSAPYVVKSPWLFTRIDALLNDGRFRLDGVIVPVRPLQEVAMSRVTVEMLDRYDRDPGLLDNAAPLRLFGSTAGGVLHSLEPLDQERILAVGFHHLVERLATSEVPFVFLAFPKIIEDGAYLYRNLRPFLPAHITEAQALAAHARIAVPNQVRTGRELLDPLMGRLTSPGAAEAEVLALRRELRRLKEDMREREARTGTGAIRAAIGKRLRRTRIWEWVRALRHAARLASAGHFRH